MLEDNKIVKSIEVKAGGKSGTYWTVTWQDDKKDNIFDGDWLPLLEQSQKENRLLHFTKEKQGKYYNINSLELATLPEEQPAVTEKVEPRRYGKSKEEMESIEHQVAVMEVGRAFCAGKLTEKDPLVLGWYLWCAERLSVTELKPSPDTLQSKSRASKEETNTTALKEIKDATTKDNKITKNIPQPQKEGEVSGQDSGEAAQSVCPINNVGELMSWASKHGKKFIPSFICQALKVKAPLEIIDIPKAYKDLKELMGWED